VHEHYGDALTRARDAGIPFLGAYHVVRSVDVGAQVDHFLNYLNAHTPWWRDFPGWFFQADLELWKYDRVSAATGDQFADLLAQRTGKVAILYASRGQYGDGLGASRDHPLWNADYAGNPTGHYRELYPGDSGRGWNAYSGQTPAIWQFSSKATIGSQPGCDANAFRGTREDFAKLIKASSPEDDAGDFVGSNADGRLQVFCIGDDGALHSIWQTVVNGEWSQWRSFQKP
jgi:GH25 family lysozyme M1 (1,4-beta-N-acetylmuramidase)